MLTVAILAGGLATRLGQLTAESPKSLLDIAGRPFVDWQLKLLSKAGVEKVVFCIGHKAEMIQKYVGDGQRYDIDVYYSEDGNTQLGTGGAIKKALALLGDEFMVLYGDSYLPIDYRAVENAFWMNGKPGLMTVYQNEGAFDVSNVIFQTGELIRYAKGQASREFSHIDFGLSVFKNSVFDPYPEGEKIDLSNICEALSDSNLLAGFELHERFYEIGSHEGIQSFTKYIERNHDVL